jgi:hypothetical protein
MKKYKGSSEIHMLINNVTSIYQSILFYICHILKSKFENTSYSAMLNTPELVPPYSPILYKEISVLLYVYEFNVGKFDVFNLSYRMMQC